MKLSIGMLVKSKIGTLVLHERASPSFQLGRNKNESVLKDGEIAVVIGVMGSDSHVVCLSCEQGAGWIPAAFLDIVSKIS